MINGKTDIINTKTSTFVEDVSIKPFILTIETIKNISKSINKNHK